MWFWSVSWPRLIVRSISPFFIWPPKIDLSQRQDNLLWSTFLIFFCPVQILESDQFSKKSGQKKCLVSETGQFSFGRPKKLRNSPDNWSAKRLKTTWTPLMYSVDCESLCSTSDVMLIKLQHMSFIDFLFITHDKMGALLFD